MGKGKALTKAELDRIVEVAERMANRMGARFVIDPEKVSTLPGGPEWLAGRSLLSGGSE